MLQDHFHPPLSSRRHWHAFHNAWATFISSQLNQHLPHGYFAEPNVQFGIEIDVAAFGEGNGVAGSKAGNATVESIPSADTPWSPGPPTLTIPMSTLTEVVEVLVYGDEGGPVLAGAIELVSPGNKDRQSERDALVSKCAAYLQQGVGLLLVDVVTDRKANLHNALIARLGEARVPESDADLYAASYRPVQRAEKTNLDGWIETLELGRVLPTMPLWLRGGISLPVELDLSYERTCVELRVPTT